MDVLKKLDELINKSKSILILTHESPDGDAIGSSLSLYEGLKSIGKDVYVILDEYPKCFNFLPNIDKVNITNNKYDLIIIVDSASINRVYDPYSNIDDNTITFSIDHHKSNTMFANYNYVDYSIPACSQILVSIFKYLNIEITKKIGEALITGIITDTGGFRYNTVNKDTFLFASNILELGVNISDIYIKVFQTITLEKYELQKIAYNRMELLYNNKVAFTYILESDEKKVNTSIGDHEGIVNIGNSIEGVEVSIFMHESNKGFRISFRSNGYVDVSDIATTFNGGGHERAAGALINEPFSIVKDKLLKEVEKYL